MNRCIKLGGDKNAAKKFETYVQGAVGACCSGIYSSCSANKKTDPEISEIGFYNSM
jgi:hypothetical protein